MFRSYALLAIAVAFNGVANVLMKAGMRGAPEDGSALAMVRHYLHSAPVLVGLVLFGLNVIAYTQALAKVPLSVAYPIMVSLTGVIVISGSMLFFREELGFWQWMGFALIVAGVICVSR